MTGASRPAAIARWLAEAFETGNSLAPLPPELAPRDLDEGEDAAAALLAALGATPIGLRIGPEGVAGPLLGPRLLANGSAVALSAVPHAQASPGLVGILAEDLTDAPPRWAGAHAAIDIAASRFTAPPGDAATLAADLGGLGLVILGKRRVMGSIRLNRTTQDAAALLAPAIAAARRLGGLPAGAVLMVAGLAPPTTPRLGDRFDWPFGAGLGRVQADFPHPAEAGLGA